MKKWAVYSVFRGEKNGLLGMSEGSDPMSAMREHVVGMSSIDEGEVLMRREGGESYYREVRPIDWPWSYCEEDQPRFVVAEADDQEYGLWVREQEEIARQDEELRAKQREMVVAAAQMNGRIRYSTSLMARMYVKDTHDARVMSAAQHIIERYEAQEKEQEDDLEED